MLECRWLVMSSLLATGAIGACSCHKVATFVDLLESMCWRCTFQAIVWWDFTISGVTNFLGFRLLLLLLYPSPWFLFPKFTFWFWFPELKPLEFPLLFLPPLNPPPLWLLGLVWNFPCWYIANTSSFSFCCVSFSSAFLIFVASFF